MVSCGNLCNMCKLCEQVTQIPCVTLSWTIRVNGGWDGITKYEIDGHGKNIITASFDFCILYNISVLNKL